MRKCPVCQAWSLEYDSYFGRYRCFNSECDWMPTSSAERAIHRLESHAQLEPIKHASIPELGLTFTAEYDNINDALLFDFGLTEPTFDLPEPDGRIVWEIARTSGSVSGFAILEAKKLGVSMVHMNIKARKIDLEGILKRLPDAFAAGRPTGALIEYIELTIKSTEQKDGLCAFSDVFEAFDNTYVNAGK